MKEFNFFKPYLKVSKSTKKDSNVLSIVGVVLGFLAVVAIAGITAYLWLSLSTLDKEVQALNRVLSEDSVKMQMEKLSELESEIADIEREKMFMDGLDVQFNTMSKVNGAFMDFIAHEVVDNLYLTLVEIKDTSVVMEGVSLNRMGIAQFEYDLRKNGNFENILVDIIEKSEESESFKFKMSLKVKGGGSGEDQ